jgi:hypothetical protein
VFFTLAQQYLPLPIQRGDIGRLPTIPTLSTASSSFSMMEQ